MSMQAIDRSRAPQRLPSVAVILARANEKFAAWLDDRARRRHERRAMSSLKAMSDHALKDIGLHRSEVTSVVRRSAEGRRQSYDRQLR